MSTSKKRHRIRHSTLPQVVVLTRKRILGRIQKSRFYQKIRLSTAITKVKKWAGLDSNQRKLTLMGLQPIPFSHSGTDPIFISKEPAIAP